MSLDVSEALFDLTDEVELRVVAQTVEDFEVKNRTEVELPFSGVLQPVPPQKLMVKPEGQRSWQWWTLHTVKVLETGTKIIDPVGRIMQVMSVQDWGGIGGYQIYEIAQAPS